MTSGLIGLVFNKKFITQVLRFGVTGVLATATQLLMVIFLVHRFSIHPLDANVAGFASGFVVSFLGNRYWTFSGTSRAFMVSLPSFLAVSILNFFLNQGLYYFCLEHLHIPYIPALLLVAAICALFTFSVSKILVFKH